MSAEPSRIKHEFKVSIGIDLPKETLSRIEQAIQRSVLSELAGVQFGRPISFNFGGQIGGNHHPQGIVIEPPVLSNPAAR